MGRKSVEIDGYIGIVQNTGIISCVSVGLYQKGQGVSIELLSLDSTRFQSYIV